MAFATEGVSGFMGSVVGMEPHTLVSKLEGFAVQGLTGKHAHFTYSASMTPITGAAKNYKDSLSELRSEIRKIINVKLRTC